MESQVTKIKVWEDDSNFPTYGWTITFRGKAIKSSIGIEAPHFTWQQAYDAAEHYLETGIVV